MLGQITCGNILLCVRQYNCFILYVKFLYHGRESMIIHRTWYTVNPVLSPPPPHPSPPGRGLIYFKPFEGGEGGLIETGGLFERGGFFNLETTMVSALYKELEYNVEKLRYKAFQVKQVKDQNQSQTKPSRISPHKVLRSWLINTVYHLLVKKN